MAERLFCVPCATHRRCRRFPTDNEIFHTQYDTQFFSVFQAEHNDMLFETCNFLFLSLLANKREGTIPEEFNNIVGSS